MGRWMTSCHVVKVHLIFPLRGAIVAPNKQELMFYYDLQHHQEHVTSSASGSLVLSLSVSHAQYAVTLNNALKCSIV